MNERIVALDVGNRRIGIAVSDPLGLTAQPLETYTRVGYGPDTRHIKAICDRYETSRVLCGLPRNMDGSEGFQVERVREFARQLEQAGLAVEYQDERMTTMVAEGALLEANMRRENRKQKVDMVAAVVILQSYLDAMHAQGCVDKADDEEPEETGEDDGILEMEDEEGNVLRFVLNATIPYEGEEYVLLSAAQASGDIEMDESFIMRATADDEGNPCYQSLEDEALIAAVYEAYLRQSEGD